MSLQASSKTLSYHGDISLYFEIMKGTCKQEHKVKVTEYVQKLLVSREFENALSSLENNRKSTSQVSLDIWTKEETSFAQANAKMERSISGNQALFRTVYKMITASKVTKLYHFDFLKLVYMTETPTWIRWSRKWFITETRNERRRNKWIKSLEHFISQPGCRYGTRSTNQHASGQSLWQ